MRRRGVTLFGIYTIVFVLCAIVGTYADYCVAQSPNSNVAFTYNSVSMCCVWIAAVCIICLVPKILQMITGWKFLSFLCIFTTLMSLLEFFNENLVDNPNEPGVILVALAITALAIITIILEIRELSR